MSGARRMAGRGPLGPQAGLSLPEAMLAVALVGLGLLGTMLSIRLATQQLTLSRELTVARLATTNVIEACTSWPVRRLSSTDTTTTWLYGGGYEIARTSTGVAFMMPDVKSAAKVAEGSDTALRWVRVDFPVPPLVGVTTADKAGRLLLFVDETKEPANIPTYEFPFPKSVTTNAAFKYLDCDGDVATSTADLRVGYDTATRPTRIVPARVIIEWKSSGGSVEKLDVPFICVQPGF